MSIKLYNTLTRRKEDFTPLDPDRVTMYLCGPTVYSYAHIGNARPAVVFDVLNRLLRHHYKTVVFARNITDVDDKIIAASEVSGEPIDAITERFTDIYNEDMQALGVLPPDIEPRATAHMPEMIAMIAQLIETGHAYESDQHVLFSVTSYPDYGKLANRSLDDMQAGARVEVADYKRHPGDFVLWKPSADGQVGWDSPWGRGRPGWHIECSAMSARHLGKTIDIHCGGIDLIFPHHENEIAQSCCAHPGTPFVRYWVHNGFLTMNQDKMAKSVGNVLTVNELRKRVHPEVLRLALLSAQYRQPLDWNEDVVQQATDRLDKMYCTLRSVENIQLSEDELTPGEEMLAALGDDLNTPKALAVMAKLVSRINVATDDDERRVAKAQLLASGRLMGLLELPLNEWLQNCQGRALSSEQINALVTEREHARANRNFQRADEIRQQLTDASVQIEDSNEGTLWKFLQ